MKLSVALESTKIFLLAMACKVLNETCNFIEQYLVIYTDLQAIALAQAVGFKRPKNPACYVMVGMFTRRGLSHSPGH